jgi:hypothetical protein
MSERSKVKKMRRRDVPLWARRLAAAFEFAGITNKKGNVDKQRVGTMLHVVPKTVESWITGRTQPRYEALIRVREITNISLDWILADRMLATKGAPEEHRHAQEESIKIFKTIDKG